MPGKRIAGSALHHLAKLRRVQPDQGETQPMAVYMSSRLDPAGQDYGWKVSQAAKGGQLQISGSLVRSLAMCAGCVTTKHETAVTLLARRVTSRT